MQATPFEFRFRYAIHTVIYILGFVAPWNYAAQHYGVQIDHGKTLWEWASITLFQHGWLRFEAASIVLLLVATLAATLGAVFRTWGTAYIGAGIVESSGMHGSAIVADGPYRHLRNPLYLGTIFHTVGLSLIMPPTGALFTVVLISVFQLRLILAEEPFLTAKLGQPYIDYCMRVSRLLPSATPRIPASGARPHWLQSISAEIYFIAVAVSFATFGWHYNAFLLIKCVVVAFGLSLVARAFSPKQTA